MIIINRNINRTIANLPIIKVTIKVFIKQVSIYIS